MPFANWIPSLYGFYQLHKSTKEAKEKKPHKQLNAAQWESRKIADMKKRPQEYSFLNSDGVVIPP